MKLTPDTVDDRFTQATFHRVVVEATKAEVEAKLGLPTFEYFDGEKERTEFDEVTPDGNCVVLSDHHHYGELKMDEEVQWGVYTTDPKLDVPVAEEFGTPETVTKVDRVKDEGVTQE